MAASGSLVHGGLSLVGLGVDVDDRQVLDGIDLQVEPGETVAILGPSGCGKTTLLRAIAGLEPVARGRITWDGQDLETVEPHRRRFGLVFQDYALFGHRDVLGNVEFGLAMQRVPRSQRRARATAALARVGLDGFEHRDVARLSGGERQRVALARALVVEPRLLMLDEPLAALDRDLRARLLADLRAALRATSLPALYVTHDQAEAFGIGDRVAVMHDGALVQVDEPAPLYRHPVSPWVAEFLGFGPSIVATVERGVLATPWGAAPTELPDGAVTFVVRPGDVVAGVAIGGAATAVGAVVRDVRFGGAHWDVIVSVDGAPDVVVRTDSAPRPGDVLSIGLAPRPLLTFPR